MSNINVMKGVKPMVWLLASLVFWSASETKRTKIGSDISVELPPELFAMSPEDITLRFPSVRAPLGAFTNQDRVVDFSVNISATQWPDADIALAQKFFKSGITNLYDKVDFISDGIKTHRKKSFIEFEFESRVGTSQRQAGQSELTYKYTLIRYLVQPGRTLVFAFSCPRNQREQWQPVAHQIMESIRVR
jgi:hypothetical protein